MQPQILEEHFDQKTKENESLHVVARHLFCMYLPWLAWNKLRKFLKSCLGKGSFTANGVGEREKGGRYKSWWMEHETNFWLRCLVAWPRIFVTFICHKLFYVINIKYIRNERRKRYAMVWDSQRSMKKLKMFDTKDRVQLRNKALTWDNIEQICCSTRTALLYLLYNTSLSGYEGFLCYLSNACRYILVQTN